MMKRILFFAAVTGLSAAMFLPVLARDVPAGSALAKAGLRKNVVILFVNGGNTTDTAALLRQVPALSAGGSLKLDVSRDQKGIVIQLIPQFF